MKQPKPIIISDGPEIQNVLIQINLKKQTTTVISSASAWENLAFIMEALKVTSKQCIVQGMDKKQVYKGINDYLTNLFNSETIVWK